MTNVLFMYSRYKIWCLKCYLQLTYPLKWEKSRKIVRARKQNRISSLPKCWQSWSDSIWKYFYNTHNLQWMSNVKVLMLFSLIRVSFSIVHVFGISVQRFIRSDYLSNFWFESIRQMFSGTFKSGNCIYYYYMHY